MDHAYVSVAELKRLHVAAVALHLTSAILGLLITKSGDPAVPVNASLVRFEKGSLLVADPKLIFSPKALLPSIVVEFITAFFHVVYFFALTRPAVDALVRRIADTPSANPLRWVEYAITATLMSAFGNTAVGISDFYYFLKTVFTGVCLQAVGYVIELLDVASPRDGRLFNIMWWVLGFGLNLPSIGILLYQIFASHTGSSQRLFIENCVPFAVWYNTFGLVAMYAYKKEGKFRDKFYSERWYTVLSLSTKLAVFWLGFGTFKKISEDNHVSGRAGVDWDAVRYSAMSLPAAVVLVYIWYDWRTSGRSRRLATRTYISYTVWSPVNL